MRIPRLLRPPAAWLRLPRRTARLRLTLLYSGLFLVSGAAMLAITNILARTTGLFSFSEPPHCTTVNGLPNCESSEHLIMTSGARRELHLTGQAAAAYAADLRHLLVLSGITLAIMTLVSVALGWAVAGRVLRPLRTITTAARVISASTLHQRLAVAGPDDEFKRLADILDELFGRLEAAFDAQRHFVANASHELRTPLALEQTLLEVALGDPDVSADALRSTCEELLAAGGQQQRLIEALLTLASSERGLDRREPFDLAEVTSQALLAAQPEIARRGLHAATMISPAPVTGDPDLARHLAANLNRQRRSSQRPRGPDRAHHRHRPGPRRPYGGQHRPGDPARRGQPAPPAFSAAQRRPRPLRGRPRPWAVDRRRYRPCPRRHP